MLLIAEQGLGDSLQFIRYAPLLKQLGATVIFECPEKLLKLFAGMPGIDILFPQGTEAPAHDVHAALMSLPGLLGTTLETVPAEVPYIHPDPARVERWGARAGGVSRVQGGDQLAGEPRVRGRLPPLDAPAPLRAAGAGAGGAALQPAEVRRDGAAQGAGRGVPGGRPGEPARRGGCERAVPGYGGGAEEPRPVRHLGHGGGAPGRGAGGAGVGAAVDVGELAVDARARGQPVVSDDAALPPGDAARLAAGLRADGGRAAGTGAGHDEGPVAVAIDVAPGELIDKLTILEIKAERIRDPEKLAHVRHERGAAGGGARPVLVPSAELLSLWAELRTVNEELWQVEDAIRDCDRRGDFGPEFIALAQSVYRTNDRRAALKRRINVRLGSEVVEEKSYGTEPAEARSGDPRRTTGPVLPG